MNCPRRACTKIQQAPPGAQSEKAGARVPFSTSTGKVQVALKISQSRAGGITRYSRYSATSVSTISSGDDNRLLRTQATGPATLIGGGKSGLRSSGTGGVVKV